MVTPEKPTRVAMLRLTAPADAPARKNAWTQITQGDVVSYLWSRHKMKRDQVTVSDFERAKRPGTDDFVALYAKAIGQPLGAVREAWDEERRTWLRKAKAGRRPGR